MHSKAVALAGHKYGFNGKEKQPDLGLEWLDYGARMYDAQVGRWMVQDKFSEVYNSLTSYHYAANNPIKNIDEAGHLLKDKEGNVIATSDGNAKIIERKYDTHKGQVTIKLKQVTVYTDEGTPVQAYQAIKAYLAEYQGDGVESQQEISLTKNMRANCHGFAFASGKVWFIDDTPDGSEFRKILDDEYDEVDEPDAGIAVIEWSKSGEFLRAHSGKINKNHKYDHKDEMYGPKTEDSKDGFEEGHTGGGNGIYKVDTKYYQRKNEKDKEASLPKVSVDGVRIVSQDEIKKILKDLGLSN